MWTAMESRVTRRSLPPRLGSEAAAKRQAGRSNIKKTEEDHWLEAGVYEASETASKANKDKK